MLQRILHGNRLKDHMEECLLDPLLSAPCLFGAVGSKFRVVDLALNQAAKPWFHLYSAFRSIGTICGGLFPKMNTGQICNLEIYEDILSYLQVRNSFSLMDMEVDSISLSLRIGKSRCPFQLFCYSKIQSGR